MGGEAGGADPARGSAPPPVAQCRLRPLAIPGAMTRLAIGDLAKLSELHLGGIAGVVLGAARADLDHIPASFACIGIIGPGENNSPVARGARDCRYPGSWNLPRPAPRGSGNGHARMAEACLGRGLPLWQSARAAVNRCAKAGRRMGGHGGQASGGAGEGGQLLTFQDVLSCFQRTLRGPATRRWSALKGAHLAAAARLAGGGLAALKT